MNTIEADNLPFSLNLPTRSEPSRMWAVKAYTVDSFRKTRISRKRPRGTGPKKTLEVLVHWKGFSEASDSWEPLPNLVQDLRGVEKAAQRSKKLLNRFWLEPFFKAFMSPEAFNRQYHEIAEQIDKTYNSRSTYFRDEKLECFWVRHPRKSYQWIKLSAQADGADDQFLLLRDHNIFRQYHVYNEIEVQRIFDYLKLKTGKDDSLRDEIEILYKKHALNRLMEAAAEIPALITEAGP